MALTATVTIFELSISDMDRGVYDQLTLNVACHPSESAEYMLTRVIAHGLEQQEGLSFSRGLAFADEPALWVKDLTGRMLAWIEVGTPAIDRLHKAAKGCDRVVVYCHKEIGRYLENLSGGKISHPERVSIVALDPALIEALSERLQRRNVLNLSVTEGTIYLDLNGESHVLTPTRHAPR